LTTLQAEYSIELARFSNPLGLERSVKSNAQTSNITLGSANLENYADATGMSITSLANFTYALDYFGFGKVYMTDGAASSAYFQNFDMRRPVEFAINF